MGTFHAHRESWSEAMTEEENVIDLDAIVQPMRVVRGSQSCAHSRTYIDDRLRTLACQACNATLDPIQFLIEVANRERLWRFSPEQRANLEWRYRELERAVDEKRKERDRLTSEIRRLKTSLINTNQGE